jgi:uncharacterized protein involved in exopolysaccharide biosynthesis
MNMAVDFEEDSKSLGDYLKILKRRRRLIIVPGLITFFIIAITAMLWPPTYKSEATILIEEQAVPRDFVRSSVTSFAAQQIQVITQRVMTMTNILKLVNQFELYSENELKRLTKTEIALEFQEKLMNLDVVSADVVDPVTGRPTVATIAFSLSFKHASPKKAQKVTNELVNLYLNENLRIRTEKSINTSSFLAAEATSLANKLVLFEADLAAFKELNKDSLPEFYMFNLSTFDRVERELSDAESRINELEKSKFDFEGQLVQLSPYAPTVLASGERILSDYDRLKAQESEYNRKSAIYNKDHPDLIRLNRELEELRKTVGSDLSVEDKAIEKKIEQDRLAELNNQYTPDHPKVIAQRRLVASLDSSAITNASEKNNKISPDNPSYILLDTRIKSANAEIAILKTRQKDLLVKKAHYENLIMNAPMVEQKYAVLQRDYVNAQVKYRELKSKEMEADLSRSLEEGRQGERFTLIQPANIPESPVSPNRPAIIMVGLILAIGVGFACAMVAELLDQSVRGVKQLTEIIGSAPIISMPYIYLDEELEAKNKKLYYILAGLFASGLVFLACVHFLWKPLDVIWFILLRKFGLQ